MSHFTMFPTELLRHPLSGTELKVLIGLYSFRSKNTDTCWPSQGVLAEVVGINDVTYISKVIRKLVKKGYLEKSKRGFTGTLTYKLIVPELSNLGKSAKLDKNSNTNLGEYTKVESPNLDETPKLGKSTNTNLDEITKSNLDKTPKCKEQPIEQTIEHKKTNKKIVADAPEFDWQEAFDQFWSEYPKKKSKDTARSKFKTKCKTQAEFDSIMDGLVRQIPHWNDPQFIPYPAKWLNGGAWKDEFGSGSGGEVGLENMSDIEMIQFLTEKGVEDARLMNHSTLVYRMQEIQS